MFLRQHRKDGHTYWSLVESYRTEGGLRQRVVSYLGDLSESARAGVEALAEDRPCCVQYALFDEDIIPDWQEVDTGRVVVENAREFGAWWVGLWLMQKLGLIEQFRALMPGGGAKVAWSGGSLLHELCSPRFDK